MRRHVKPVEGQGGEGDGPDERGEELAGVRRSAAGGAGGAAVGQWRPGYDDYAEICLR